MPPQRIGPPPLPQRSEQVTQLLDSLRLGPDDQLLELFATLAHHPRLLKRWSAFGGTLLFSGELPARDRELLILRTSWNCEATYEWVHHEELARRAGVTEDEIARIAEGPGAAGWNSEDEALLRAADDLHHQSRISDAAWGVLSERFTEAQLIEVCMLVGQYHLVAFTLRSLGVQLEEEV